MRIIKGALLGVAVMAMIAPGAWAQMSSEVPATATAQETAPGRFLVFFEFDRADLRPDGQRVVREAADEYQRTGNVRVELVGNADRSGSDDYNIDLSARRAETVRQALISAGVPASVISVNAEGESAPLVATADGVREALNRYVEITFPIAEPAPAIAAAPPPEPMEEPEPRQPLAEVTIGGIYGYQIKDLDAENEKSSNLLGADIGFSLLPTRFGTLGVNQWIFYNRDSEDEGWGGRSVVNLKVQGDIGWPVAPYLGLNAGYIYGAGVQSGIVVGPEIGGKFNFNERTFLYIKAGYDWNLRNEWNEGLAYTGAGVGFRF
jgi:hypothetical protein